MLTTATAFLEHPVTYGNVIGFAAIGILVAKFLGAVWRAR